MDPHNGKLYPDRQSALDDGVKDPVMMYGEEYAIARISKAVQGLGRAERRAETRRLRKQANKK